MYLDPRLLVQGTATIISHQCVMQECWLDSWLHFSNSLLIPVYQIRIYVSHDDILRMYTKIYRNNNKSLILDSRISPVTTWFLEPSMWFRIIVGSSAECYNAYFIEILHFKNKIFFGQLGVSPLFGKDSDEVATDQLTAVVDVTFMPNNNSEIS